MEYHSAFPPLPPTLEIQPITNGQGHRPRILNLGLTLATYALLGGAAFLIAQSSAFQTRALIQPRHVVGIQLFEPNEDEHSGGGGSPRQEALAKAPAPTEVAPQPKPSATAALAESIQPVPLDTSKLAPLPTEPIHGLVVSGAHGGNGLGNGTGSGVGDGSGDGSGSGPSGRGGHPVTQPEPMQVAYSEIGFIKTVQPAYSEKARRIGLRGDVIVRVTIDENGLPVDFKVIKGHPLFVTETLKVLPLWRCAPVILKGKKVRAVFDAVLQFDLA